MSNFAKYENLETLFSAIGKKKLSVSDTMPTAGAAYEDICILYIGPTDANYTKGYVYECEEVTPATDPKTYSWNAKINVDVDLSKYKTIFPGTKEEWEALTEAQQDQYDYCFFDGDESDYYAVSDEVAMGDMHPVTSNAVAENIQDIVNVYGSKNLCPTFASGTVAGVVYTVNSDGSITAVGTSNATTAFGIITNANLPNGKYIMSAGADASTDLRFVVKIVKGGITNYYEVDSANEEVPFTVNDPDNLDIYVRTNGGDVAINGTLYPMIRCASISDNSYVPYAKTNRQLTQNIEGILENVEVNNVVNMAPVTKNTIINEGITFTRNSDDTFTLNGTQTAQAACNTLDFQAGYKLPKGTYKLTGCPKDGGTNTYTLSIYTCNDTSGSGATSLGTDRGNGLKFTVDGTKYIFIQIRVYYDSSAPQTLNDVIFKPMISVPSLNLSYDDYVPYGGRTNKGLTDIADKLLFGGTGVSVSAVTDLNTPLTSQGGASFNVSRFINNTTNAPYTGGGLVFTWASSPSYGAQLVLGNGGFWFRGNTQGTISSWQKLTT